MDLEKASEQVQVRVMIKYPQHQTPNGYNQKRLRFPAIMHYELRIMNYKMP